MSNLLKRLPAIHQKFETVNIFVPQAMVITTEGFEAFIETNNLKGLSKSDAPDEEIAETFLKAVFPQWIAAESKPICQE